jgi:hypothetical protein
MASEFTAVKQLPCVTLDFKPELVSLSGYMPRSLRSGALATMSSGGAG